MSRKRQKNEDITESSIHKEHKNKAKWKAVEGSAEAEYGIWKLAEEEKTHIKCEGEWKEQKRNSKPTVAFRLLSRACRDKRQ